MRRDGREEKQKSKVAPNFDTIKDSTAKTKT